MRRDFDYVAMDDYKADMDEQSKLAAGIIEKLKIRERNLERQVWLLVRAAGGELSVTEQDLARADFDKSKLIIHYSPADMKYIFEARP